MSISTRNVCSVYAKYIIKCGCAKQFGLENLEYTCVILHIFFRSTLCFRSNCVMCDVCILLNVWVHIVHHDTLSLQLIITIVKFWLFCFYRGCTYQEQVWGIEQFGWRISSQFGKFVHLYDYPTLDLFSFFQPKICSLNTRKLKVALDYDFLTLCIVMCWYNGIVYVSGQRRE
jgi:hypothetical protein